MTITKKLDWCLCWRSTWQFEMMADGHGYCKHCNKKIKHFFAAPAKKEAEEEA